VFAAFPYLADHAPTDPAPKTAREADGGHPRRIEVEGRRGYLSEWALWNTLHHLTQPTATSSRT
jgi:hypothetical protein